MLIFTGSETKQELHIIMILSIMFCTIYFGHSFIRLVMITSRPLHNHDATQRGANRVRRSWYAQPEQPIPVTLTRDVEAALFDNGGTMGGFKPNVAPPPAYGALENNVVSEALYCAGQISPSQL